MEKFQKTVVFPKLRFLFGEKFVSRYNGMLYLGNRGVVPWDI